MRGFAVDIIDSSIRDKAKHVILVGSEAAGSDVYHSGDPQMDYRLPKTNIEVYFSIVGAQKNEAVIGQITGMKPDKICDMNSEALLDNRDLVLDCVFEEILTAANE